MISLPPYIYVIALSFLVSLSVYYKTKTTGYQYLKLFPPFLLVTLIIEYIGAYRATTGDNNVLLYNLFSTFEFCFYLFILSLIIINASVRRIICIMMILYAIAALVNIFFIQKLFHTVTYSIGCLLVVSVCIYYFFELFRLPKYVKLKNNPAFWICSGLLFFYCCGFPLFGLVNYWAANSPILVRNFTEIVGILNIFLYSLFMIAFLCVRTRKYTLSPS
jgi:hypothetical protein